MQLGAFRSARLFLWMTSWKKRLTASQQDLILVYGNCFTPRLLIACGLALGPGTILPTIIVLACWSYVFLQRNRNRAVIAVALILLFFCLGGLMFPAVSQVREAARRTHCMNNMRQIMLAILNHESAYGHFPTDRVVTLADGTELRHSWRVLILPFLESSPVYDMYDFNEPWDGPNNSKLETMIFWSVFQCPSHDIRHQNSLQTGRRSGNRFRNW